MENVRSMEVCNQRTMANGKDHCTIRSLYCTVILPIGLCPLTIDLHALNESINKVNVKVYKLTIS